MVIPDSNRIPNFWQSSSKFLCNADRNSLSEVGSTFAKYFTLPDNVRDVRKLFLYSYFSSHKNFIFFKDI